MSRGCARIAGWFGAFALIGACTTDFGGYRFGDAGGGDAGGTPQPDASDNLPDGGDAPPASMDGAPDASDATTSDGGAPGGDEGGTEQPVPDAGSRAFCETVSDAELCVDFEDGTLDEWDWTEVRPEPGPSVMVVDDGSGGRALRASLSGAGEESARVVEGVPGTVAHALIGFDIYPELDVPDEPGPLIVWCRVQQDAVPDDADGGSDRAYPGISLGAKQDEQLLYIQNFDGVSSQDELFSLPLFPPGWVHVDLEITFGPSGSVKVSYNGAVVLAQTNLPIESANVLQTALQIGLYTQRATHSTALYDNVTVALEQ